MTSQETPITLPEAQEGPSTTSSAPLPSSPAPLDSTLPAPKEDATLPDAKTYESEGEGDDDPEKDDDKAKKRRGGVRQRMRRERQQLLDQLQGVAATLPPSITVGDLLQALANCLASGENPEWIVNKYGRTPAYTISPQCLQPKSAQSSAAKAQSSNHSSHHVSHLLQGASSSEPPMHAPLHLIDPWHKFSGASNSAESPTATITPGGSINGGLAGLAPSPSKAAIQGRKTDPGLNQPRRLPGPVPPPPPKSSAGAPLTQLEALQALQEAQSQALFLDSTSSYQGALAALNQLTLNQSPGASPVAAVPHNYNLRNAAILNAAASQNAAFLNANLALVNQGMGLGYPPHSHPNLNLGALYNVNALGLGAAQGTQGPVPGTPQANGFVGSGPASLDAVLGAQGNVGLGAYGNLGFQPPYMPPK